MRTTAAEREKAIIDVAVQMLLHAKEDLGWLARISPEELEEWARTKLIAARFRTKRGKP